MRLGVTDDTFAPMQARRSIAPHSNERRSVDRFESTFDVDMTSESNFFQGFSEDLSDGGIFVATHAARRIGDRLSIAFTLPGIETPIRADVEVRWLRAYDEANDTSPGFGARFVDISDDDRALIHRFLSLRNPLFFDAD